VSDRVSTRVRPRTTSRVDSRMAHAEHATIYVYLLGEGVDVWRPVDAVRVGESLYRITSDCSDQRFAEESWQFVTGDVVRCTRRELAEGELLVAVERVETAA